MASFSLVCGHFVAGVSTLLSDKVDLMVAVMRSIVVNCTPSLGAGHDVAVVANDWIGNPYALLFLDLMVLCLRLFAVCWWH